MWTSDRGGGERQEAESIRTRSGRGAGGLRLCKPRGGCGRPDERQESHLVLPKEFMQKGQELFCYSRNSGNTSFSFLPQTSLFCLKHTLTYLCLDFSNSEKSESRLWHCLFHKTQSRPVSFTSTVLRLTAYRAPGLPQQDKKPVPCPGEARTRGGPDPASGGLWPAQPRDSRNVEEQAFCSQTSLQHAHVCS